MDLLIERALYGLDPAQQAELTDELKSLNLSDDGDISELIALVDLSFAETEQLPPLDKRLRESILKRAIGQSLPVLPKRNRFREPLAWAVAAAALVFAFITYQGSRSGSGSSSPTTLEDQLSGLVGESTTIHMAWQAVAPAPFSEVTGEVVWSKSRNEGLMIFQGLPVNDPKVAQYQLWIVDPSRDERPVDGGVFNVTSSGRIIVPVNQKLTITDPKAFVITQEKPGGVVVSAGPFLLKADAP
jgi:hypothetical protein